jgi:hypothetical protein
VRLLSKITIALLHGKKLKTLRKMTMKQLLLTLFAALTLISISTTSFAACPSGLTADDMYECIMMEGSGDLDYRKWAPEFYKKYQSAKSRLYKFVYVAEMD